MLAINVARTLLSYPAVYRPNRASASPTSPQDRRVLHAAVDDRVEEVAAITPHAGCVVCKADLHLLLARSLFARGADGDRALGGADESALVGGVDAHNRGASGEGDHL